jgi:hypothetical protein
VANPASVHGALRISLRVEATRDDGRNIGSGQESSRQCQALNNLKSPASGISGTGIAKDGKDGSQASFWWLATC